MFRILSQSEQVVRDLTFENITVDVTKHYCGKIFHLHVRDGKEASYTERRGFAIENVTFRNIRIRGNTEELYPSVLLCREAEEDEGGEKVPHVSDVTFENVTVGDRPLSKQDFRIGGDLRRWRV